MKYTFNNPKDMINLALSIQSKVYWDGYFWIFDEEDNDDIQERWKYFWAYAQAAYSQGAKGVLIDQDTVTFIYK